MRAFGQAFDPRVAEHAAGQVNGTQARQMRTGEQSRQHSARAQKGDAPKRRLRPDGIAVVDEIARGHHDVFGDRNDVRAGDFCNCDTAICLICRVEVDMVRPNASGDCELELLRLCETFSSKVTRVEAV